MVGDTNVLDMVYVGRMQVNGVSHSPSQQSTSTVGPAVFQLPVVLKQQLCALLDRPTPEHNDWRALAQRLFSQCYVQVSGRVL
jgi:hypothetical protein